MIWKRLINLWIKRKTKGYKQIPLFFATFDYVKYKEHGEKDSCMVHIHPEIDRDEFLLEKIRECIDYIREKYDMDIFTKI